MYPTLYQIQIFSEKEIKFDISKLSTSFAIFKRNREGPSRPVSLLSKRKSIKDIRDEDARKWFREIEIKTSAFTKNFEEVLLENPQNLLIFRIILGVGHRKFAKMIGKNPRSIRKWEHLEQMMKRSTASEIAKKIKELLKTKRISLQNFLFNLKVLKNEFGHRNVDALIKRGIEFAKNSSPNDLEKKIANILKAGGVEFELHGVVSGISRDFCVDFVIRRKEKPIILIEAFKFSLKSKSPSNSKVRIDQVDHRFQVIKARWPNVKCIMCVEFDREIHPATVEILKLDLMNTDAFLVNDEIEKLGKIIRRELLYDE
ncbi:MAG: hypothetical protein J7K98_02390 [Candidatus Aenigmarchaeota archaeon]|nr:hypothetical protein [Candidatus Aenigmarchaeota archaeon]